MSALFDDLDQPIVDEPRVRAIAPAFDEHRIDALFNAPGAFTWMLDDFLQRTRRVHLDAR